MGSRMQHCPGQKYLFDAPTGGEIAKVCARIIRAVKADYPGLSNAELAKAIGSTDKKGEVIERLENAETQKVPASLVAVIGHTYGAEYIQPYMELMGLKAVPVHCATAINAMPALTALVAKLAIHVRNGAALDDTGLAAMLSELRDADGAISSLRSIALEMGLAA